MPSTLDAKPSLVAGESRPKEKRTDQNEDHHNEHRKRKREEGEVVPLHLRPRKLNFWDQKPENYESMTAAQVKATGMFLLPSHLLKGIKLANFFWNRSETFAMGRSVDN